MVEITASMVKYKEAIRHVWNVYFASVESPMSPDVQSAYLSIERALLRVLVLGPHNAGELSEGFRKGALTRIEVRVDPKFGEVPVLFGRRDMSGNMCWEAPLVVPAKEVRGLEFFDFFDWRPYEQVDLQYVRSKIGIRFAIQPAAEMILVEHMYCRMYLHE